MKQKSDVDEKNLNKGQNRDDEKGERRKERTRGEGW